MFADEKQIQSSMMPSLVMKKNKSSKDDSKVAVGPPTWLANLGQGDQEKLIQLLAQAISEYGSFTQDVKEDLKRKFSIKVLFFCFFFKNRLKIKKNFYPSKTSFFAAFCLIFFHKNCLFSRHFPSFFLSKNRCFF